MVDSTNDSSSILNNASVMNTYCDLYDALSRRPSFVQAQKDAADHVFRALYPFVNQGLVDRIVDLGCGDGEILKQLRARFARAYPDLSVKIEELQLFGIDSDVRLIDKLEQGSIDRVSLQFRLADAVSIHDLVNDKTALLVLGHTIFHFAHSLESLDQFMTGLKPVLWVIDCHRTWNEALALARAKRGGVALEPVWEEASGGRIICLRTAAFDGTCVRRGLVRRADCSEEQTQALFETTQLAVSTDELKKKFAELDYFVALSYEYYSSWGPMSSYVFVRDVTLEAKNTNDSWYTAVSLALAEIFRPPTNPTTPTSQDRFAAVRKAIGLYKVRCAAVILPFDRIHTFARYAPLDCGESDDLDSTGIWRSAQPRVMLLEEPSQDQAKYPTAYGLFTCILGRTSSMQVFPLRLIANYQMAQVDRIFSDYESNFFEGCTAHGTRAESERAYFLLPVFFGCLPLFVLVLQFGDTFSELDTGPGLFRSCLLDLHQQVRDVLDERFLQNRILRPFLKDAYHKLRSLDRVWHERSAKEGNDYIFSELEKRVLQYAGNKLWKSWIIALPGTPIKDKRTVATEQINLSRLLRKELDRLRRDVFFRLSHELEEVGFFVDEAHEFSPNKHRHIIIENGLSVNATLSKLADSESRHETIIDWSAKRMGLLVESEDLRESEEAFDDLKAVYCRALENTGKFRFSVRRLVCIVEMATGKRGTKIVARGCNEHAVRAIDEDPCQDLFEILQDLTIYWKQCPEVTISVSNRQADANGDSPQGLCVRVIVDFSSASAEGGMGQDSRHLLESLRRWHCTEEQPLNEPDQTRVLTALLEVGPEVENDSMWRSFRTELRGRTR